MRDNTRQDRYWNQMQRLGGTLSHLLKEVLVCLLMCTIRKAVCRTSAALATDLGTALQDPAFKGCSVLAITGATLRPRHLAS
jgi:hypothetical protein